MPRSSRQRVSVVDTIFWLMPSSISEAGYTAILSPECMPVRSTCSIMPGISISSPSHMASTSISMPERYLSISTGLSCFVDRIMLIYSSMSSAQVAIIIFCPPST